MTGLHFCHLVPKAAFSGPATRNYGVTVKTKRVHLISCYLLSAESAEEPAK